MCWFWYCKSIWFLIGLILLLESRILPSTAIWTPCQIEYNIIIVSVCLLVIIRRLWILPTSAWKIKYSATVVKYFSCCDYIGENIQKHLFWYLRRERLGQIIGHRRRVLIIFLLDALVGVVLTASRLATLFISSSQCLHMVSILASKLL